MKILKFFLVVAVLFTITACSSDDDSSRVELTSENFVGTYNVVFFEGESEETDAGSGVVVSRESFEGDTFTNAVFVFNNDGTYSSSGSYRLTTVERVTGQSSETTTEIEEFDSSGTYSLNTESRTITFDGDISDVTRFNGVNLTIETTNTETEDGDTITEEIEIRLVKQ